MNDILELFGVDEAEPPPPPPPPAKKSPPVKSAPAAAPVTPAPPPPADDPPTRRAEILDCGHMDWAGGAANEVARASGHCCANHRHQVSWSHLRGAYVRPLPMHHRRTLEKERGPGFPGYCCDDDGFYIGGLTNDCRQYSPDDRRCVVHGAPRPRVYDDDPAESVPVPDVADNEPAADAPAPAANPPLPKASGSWKQRQMSAKRGKR